MRLNQIRDLIAVSEAGSLRAAARRIGISQPAMSKSLAELEREFQAQLLTRTSRDDTTSSGTVSLPSEPGVPSLPVLASFRQSCEKSRRTWRRCAAAPRERWPSVSVRRWPCH